MTTRELIQKLRNCSMDAEIVFETENSFLGNSFLRMYEVEGVEEKENLVAIKCGKVHSMIPPTEKQRSFIKEIEGLLKIKFEGRTKQDAWKFINDNIGRFRQRQSDLQFSEMCRNAKPSKFEVEREKWLEEDRKRRRWNYGVYGEPDPYEYEIDPFGDGFGGAPNTNPYWKE